MYTEQERLIAKSLTEPDTFAFLTKVFTSEVYDKAGNEVRKNVVALDDAEYGRLMKVVYLAKEDSKNRLNAIKVIARDQSVKPVAIAPR